MKYSHLIILLLLLSFSLNAAGQTYYYEFDHKIDLTTGVRTSYGQTPVYITFTNNKSSFYQSDSDGKQLNPTNRSDEFGKGGPTGRKELYKYVVGTTVLGQPMVDSMLCEIFRECDGVFRYCGIQDSKRAYRLYYYDYLMTFVFGNIRKSDGYFYVYFSDDYNTIYIVPIYGGEQYRVVGTRKQNPNSAPTQMW